MIPDRFLRPLRAHAPVWGLMALILVLELACEWGGEPVRDALRYDRAAILDGQLWRLLTGHLVHLGGSHLLLNELGLLVLVMLCPQPLSAREWAQRLLFICLGLSLGLMIFVHALHRYVGLSGVIHGLFLLGLLPQVRQRDVIAALALAYLIGKLVWEQWTGVPVSDEAAIGGRVATESHLLGVVVAGVYAALFQGRIGNKSNQNTPSGT